MIKNYVMGSGGHILMNNEGEPVLKDVDYEAVFQRLVINHNRKLANRARIEIAKMERPPLGQKARARVHRERMLARKAAKVQTCV